MIVEIKVVVDLDTRNIRVSCRPETFAPSQAALLLNQAVTGLLMALEQERALLINPLDVRSARA